MVTILKIKEKAQADKLRKKSVLNIGYKLHRYVSVYITYVLLKLFPKVKPNNVSLAMIVLGIIGIYFLFFNTIFEQIIGIILVYISFLLDKVDGEIARYKNLISSKGAYLDDLYHTFIQPFIIISVCYSSLENEIFYGFLLGVFTFIQLNIRYQRKEREFLFLKLFKFIKNNTLVDNQDKYKKIIKFLNYWPFKVFSYVERFDIILILSLLTIIHQYYNQNLNIKIYLFNIYFVSSFIYLIRLILLNYFSGLNNKFNYLFEKYKLWL